MKAYSSNIVIAGLAFALAISSVNAVACLSADEVSQATDEVSQATDEVSKATDEVSKATDETSKSMTLNTQSPVEDDLRIAGECSCGHNGPGVDGSSCNC